VVNDRFKMINDRLMIDYHVAKDGLWWFMMMMMDDHVVNDGLMIG
jgi:hypothetical protein